MNGNKTTTDRFKIAMFNTIMSIYRGENELSEIFEDKSAAIFDTLQVCETLLESIEKLENGEE